MTAQTQPNPLGFLLVAWGWRIWYKTMHWWLHGGYMAVFAVSPCYYFCSELLSIGARDRNRTGTPVIHEAADFKSDVSTYFTTRAQ